MSNIFIRVTDSFYCDFSTRMTFDATFPYVRHPYVWRFLMCDFFYVWLPIICVTASFWRDFFIPVTFFTFLHELPFDVTFSCVWHSYVWLFFSFRIDVRRDFFTHATFSSAWLFYKCDFFISLTFHTFDFFISVTFWYVSLFHNFEFFIPVTFWYVSLFDMCDFFISVTFSYVSLFYMCDLSVPVTFWYALILYIKSAWSCICVTDSFWRDLCICADFF